MAYHKGEVYQLTKAIISLIELGISIGKDLTLKGPDIPSYHQKHWKKTEKRRITWAIKRLTNQKIISWEEDGKLSKLILTENGKKRVLKYKIDDMTIDKSAKWDGYYRVVIFDIPEIKKSAREILRKKLKELEFRQLQKSVFITSYECKNEINFLRVFYGVEKYVSYILAKEIPDFGLQIPKR